MMPELYILKNLPEIKKWDKVYNDVVTIEEFLDSLSSMGYTICEPSSNEILMVPIRQTRQELLYDHFKINGVQLEKERRALLESIKTKGE